MRDYIEIGPTPCDEQCQQVGMPSYDSEKANAECWAFLNQIRRIMGDEPDGARLSVKAFSHDFGTYREVVCYYDDAFAEAVEYAYKCEANSPSNWDGPAKRELCPEDKKHLRPWLF